ncbi:MAG: hypothetical protein E2O39_05765 [Planctomycetota bacterium]|nr:MAG: hypothetical protein E2O39_05765 [Planctomycetota bacterium]
MSKVECKRCRWFRQAPYEANRTGCWHPDNLVSSQKAAYLDEQQIPGDYRKINLRGDCAQFESKLEQPSLLRRFLSMGA